MPPKEKAAKEEWGEPKIKWGKSRARKLLYKDILDGRVPRKAKDKNNKSTKPKLKEIYEMRPEYKEYHYSKFSSRVSGVRKIIDEKEDRKMFDKEALANYISNHEVSHVSHKGYIQWQGSKAQEKALEDIRSNVHNTMKWNDWYDERSDFYENFTCHVFKEKIRQEIRAKKYLYTLEMRGKDKKNRKRNEERFVDHTNEPVVE